MSFSCRTQPPVITQVPTYTFVGNLLQAFVMYAGVGLGGSRRFGFVPPGTSSWVCLTTPQKQQLYFEKENEFLSIWLELPDLLVKNVRAYACATEENWVIAIDKEKAVLLLYSLNSSALQS